MVSLVPADQGYRSRNQAGEIKFRQSNLANLANLARASIEAVPGASPSCLKRNIAKHQAGCQPGAFNSQTLGNVASFDPAERRQNYCKGLSTSSMESGFFDRMKAMICHRSSEVLMAAPKGGIARGVKRSPPLRL